MGNRNKLYFQTNCQLKAICRVHVKHDKIKLSYIVVLYMRKYAFRMRFKHEKKLYRRPAAASCRFCHSYIHYVQKIDFHPSIVI